MLDFWDSYSLIMFKTLGRILAWIQPEPCLQKAHSMVGVLIYGGLAIMQLENDQELDTLQWNEGNERRGRFFLTAVLRKASGLGEGGISFEWRE